MKRIMFSSLIIACAMSTTAYAEDVTSQYFYQAPGMTHVFSPKLDYGMSSSKNKDYGGAGYKGESNSSGFDLGLGYLYGINEDMAIAVDLGFANNGTEVTPKGTPVTMARRGAGISDLGLKFQGRVPMMGPGNLVYGVRGNVSLMTPTRDVVGGRNNNIPGYNLLAPYVGYEMNFSFGLVGFKLDYELIRGNRKIRYTNATGGEFDETNKPGAQFTWALFYELPMDEWMVGASFDIVETASSKRSTAWHKTLPAVETQDPASQDLRFRLYSNYVLDKDIAIQPYFEYTQLMTKYREGQEMESDTDLSIGLSARFGF